MFAPHAFFPEPLIFNSGWEVTWRQDNYGCEQCIFFQCHLQLSNAFIKIKHGSYEFIWDTCENERIVIVCLNYWSILVYCYTAIISYFVLTVLVGEIYWRNHDARQLVTEVQAHPCFPEQTRHRQTLEISFCMVSKSFFQTIHFTLQICPSGSSGQVS